MNPLDFSVMSLPDLADPAVARTYLAERLHRGELLLLLGAGVSMSTGLPDWSTLVTGCEREVGIDPSDGSSSQGLMEAMDAVRRQLEREGRGAELAELVRRNLYPGAFLASDAYPDEIVEKRMLIAIGAMVMASSRGSVTDVVTFNFDDLLEWYLELHGFTTQVVQEIPETIRGDRDVRTYHAHGFLPLNQRAYRRTDWLVLSRSELVRRLSGTDSRWSTVLEGQLLSKIVLAVGTSMNDIDLDVLLHRVRTVVQKRPLGFVIVSKLKSSQRDSLFERGFVPVELGSHDAVPAFLLAVCRAAATLR